MDKFTTDFFYFWDLIEKCQNFTFTRYADGEVMLMNGIGVGELTQAHMIDKWSSPDKMTKLGLDLLDTLDHTEENYYYAISGINDNVNDHSFLKNKIKHSNKNITFVNLWINNNYQKSLKKYSELKRDVILICNENSRVENFPFKIKKLIGFPNNCVDFWENNSELFINSLISEVEGINDTLFLISCGPVSEVIIHNLYNFHFKKCSDFDLAYAILFDLTYHFHLLQ